MNYLRGARITNTGIADGEFPYFDIITAQGVALRVYVQSDEEGNGGGALMCDPLPIANDN